MMLFSLRGVGEINSSKNQPEGKVWQRKRCMRTLNQGEHGCSSGAFALAGQQRRGTSVRKGGGAKGMSGPPRESGVYGKLREY